MMRFVRMDVKQSKSGFDEGGQEKQGERVRGKEIVVTVDAEVVIDKRE